MRLFKEAALDYTRYGDKVNQRQRLLSKYPRAEHVALSLPPLGAAVYRNVLD
jgi:hypothetical protein